MMEKWKENNDKTEWKSADYLIRIAQGPKRVDIYHCYHKGSYMGQGADLKDAKGKCQAHEKLAKEQKETET
jgi:hypothetical protein